MAKVVFHSVGDMDDLNLVDWLDLSVASERTETEMVFTAVDGSNAVTETLTVGGLDFDYFEFGDFWLPTDGVVTSIVGDGELDFSITGLDIDLSDAGLALLDTDLDDLLDLVFGNDDKIVGSNGDDLLYGFGGDDVLKGGKGSDVLNGGPGFDRLMGGKGADLFVFDYAWDSTKKHPDLILDLDGKDAIDLTGLEAKGAITASYDLAKDVTTFTVDTDGDGDGDFWLRASGDHQSFGNFLI